MPGTERCAIFLDRDGTVIYDADYPKHPDEVRLLPDAAEALADLRARGFLLIVVSNQSGIGRGIVTPEQAKGVHQRFVSLLAEQGVTLDAVYYCPHSPEDRCACRKPEIGLIARGQANFGLTVERSYMVGDKPSDIEAGRRAGCRTILLVGNPLAVNCTPSPDAVAKDWREVLRLIRSHAEAKE